ncbi:unnamed protein product [Merluccius merluccius]
MGRKTFSNYLERVRKNGKRVKKAYKELHCISTTADIWSIQNRSYLGLKCFRELQFPKEYCAITKPLTVALDILQGEDNCYYGTLLPTLEVLMAKTLEKKEGLTVAMGLPDAIVQVKKDMVKGYLVAECHKVTPQPGPVQQPEGESIPPSGQEMQAEGEVPVQRAAAKKHTRKRKHVGQDVECRRRQLEEVQGALHGLLEGQEQARGPAGLSKPAARRRRLCPDELSLVASGILGSQDSRTPDHEDPEDHGESDFSEDTSQSSEPAPLDLSDGAVIARAAERAKLPPLTSSSGASVFDRGPRR